jgi:hypothetical protein
LVGVQFQPQTKPIQMDQRCLFPCSINNSAPLRAKTSNRASGRASSSRPVAVEQLNASNFMPFYPQMLLQTRYFKAPAQSRNSTLILSIKVTSMLQNWRPREKTGGSDAMQTNPQPFRTAWRLSHEQPGSSN